MRSARAGGGAGPQRSIVDLCGDCVKGARCGKPYEFSIAGGTEYSNPERVRALNGAPTLLERAVLQTVRLYGSILKVTAPAGGRGSARAAVQPSKLHGHFISFFNYGQEAVSEYLTKEAVKEVFQVHLMGPDHTMDRLKELTLGYTTMRMDTRRVYNYLTVYRAINGGAGLPEIPSPVELERKLAALAEELPAMLVADARLVTDETHVAMDRMASDDVAGVRVHPDDDEAEGSGDADGRDGGAEGDAAAGDAAGPRERAGGGDPGRAAAAEAGAAPEQRPPQPSETGGGNDAAAELFVEHRMISSRYGADNPAFGEDAVARQVHSVVTWVPDGQMCDREDLWENSLSQIPRLGGKKRPWYAILEDFHC